MIELTLFDLAKNVVITYSLIIDIYKVIMVKSIKTNYEICEKKWLKINSQEIMRVIKIDIKLFLFFFLWIYPFRKNFFND